MSATQTAPAAASGAASPVIEKQASDMLLQQVFVPHFLQKMASLGFPAQNDDQALQLLTLAESLENVPDEQVFGKQASGPDYGAAVVGLHDALGLTQKQAAVAYENAAWNKAAEYIQHNPQLYEAALTLCAAGAAPAA
jgi:hypothetical protein